MKLRLVIWLDSTDGINTDEEFNILATLGENIYQDTPGIEYQVEEDD